jgi:predicted RNA methylase
MSSEPVVEEGEEDVVPDSGTGVYYVSLACSTSANSQAIKIVDRNPKRKRLAGFNRNRAKNDGGKLINEVE